MARENEKRKSMWDDDEKSFKTTSGVKAVPGKEAPKHLSAEQLDQKIHETKILMEQTHQLYQQYFNRVEKRPPSEKVRLLESKVNELQRNAGNAPVTKFKVNQFITLYHSFKDMWDRKLRQHEKK